ncbi:MAG: 30S ribosomal protein S8 [Candidatus Aenigmatarchaeota archaeon]
MRHDLLSDVLYVINNAEKLGRKSCIVPASKLIKNVLKVMQKSGYIGSFEFIDDGKSGKLQIELIGRINKTRAIRPRFSVKKDEYEKWESRYLPAKDFGILIVSTSKGIMTQKDAIEKGLGGKLLCYVY